jgi:amidase
MRQSAFVPHDLRAPLRGASEGPLAGLSAAVKDMYDITGERTGGGNPTWLAAQAPSRTTAPAVRRLLGAGADIIGKTVCDEFFFSLTGDNVHYGTPLNARAPGRLPGGSSSGSAAAVGAGACDIALGSDTGGSVRVPAALNGIYGMRPTHGRISLEGAMAMAPSFDTAGWFAAGPGLLRKVGHVLLEGAGDRTAPRRMLVALDAFALVDDSVGAVLRAFLARAQRSLPSSEEVVIASGGLDFWRAAFRTIQGYEVWRIYGPWIGQHKPVLGPGIAERMAYAASVTEREVGAARSRAAAVRDYLRALMVPGTLLILPTSPSTAPPIKSSSTALETFRGKALGLTCIAGLGGLPQVSVPVGCADGCPVGLSIIASAGADEMLLDLAVSLARYCADVEAADV